MSEVTERSVVSCDNYAEIKNMLLSNDEGAKNVALTIMEQSDYKQSEIYILCLLKEAYSDVFGTHGATKFEESCPDLYQNIVNSISDKGEDNISTLSFKVCFDIAMARNNKTEIDFMLGLFTTELTALLKEYGFEFLEYVDVFVKPKAITNVDS